MIKKADYPPDQSTEEIDKQFKADARAKFRIVTDENLFCEHPDKRPAIVDGLLRCGETMNVIASPKIGKSFLVGGLAYSIVDGNDWLGFHTTEGRVLILDFELHEEELSNRLHKIKNAMQAVNEVDCISLRGTGVAIGELKSVLCDSSDPLEIQGKYAVIIVDALYRVLPTGTSESDNAQMMAIYNDLDAIAKATGSAIVVIHHTSKGSQDGKSITDVGSGAGAISRAADSHLILRPHEVADCAVLDCVTRSWKAPESKTLIWEYPLWHTSEIEPAVKSSKPKPKQDQNDEITKEEVRNCLSEESWRSVSQIRKTTGYGKDRVERCLNVLLKGLVESKTVKNRTRGGRVEVYKLLPLAGGKPCVF